MGADRLVAAAVRGRRVETFVVAADNAAATLRAELDQRGLRPRSVALGLPRTAVTVKPVALPAVDDDADLGDMVRFELERHLPGGAEDAAFAFTPLPAERDGDEETRVVVAAADRRLVETAVRIAAEARLRPASVTVASHDLVGLVAPGRRHRVVWVHRSPDGLDLLFLAGATVALSRFLPADDRGRAAVEVTRSLTVIRWPGCDAVWISGDPLDREVTAALGTLGPLSEPPWTGRARELLADVGEEPRGDRELAVAVAAAGATRPLDLLPLPLRPRRLSRGQLATIGLAGLVALLGVAALLAPGYRDSQRLARVNARIAVLDPEVRGVEQTLRELERQRRLLTTVESLAAASVRPLPVLRELTELLPGDAWLTLLAVDAKGVELTGQAAAAAALIPLLENSPRLERAEFSSPVTRGRDREQFRIRAGWEGGSPAVTAIRAGEGEAEDGDAPAPRPTERRRPTRPPVPMPGGGTR